MLNIINNSSFDLFLCSALEQFELVSLRGPECGFLPFLVSFFIPKQLFTNFTFSIFVIFFYLFLLTELRSFLPKGYYGLDSVVSEEEGEDFDLSQNLFAVTSGKNKVIVKEGYNTVNFDYFDLPLESVFVIYSLVNFVQNQILENLLYFKSVFLNYTLALFLFLLVCNLLGMVPYSLTVTSYLILTLNLSGMSFFANLILAFRVHGLSFFKFFIPSGVTGPLTVLMVVIELISYVARLFSMAIRLFANMLSGHALIKILSGLVFLSFSDFFFFGIVGFLFNLVLLAVTALEVVVAALQSFVFVILSVVYTNEAIVLH